MKQKTRFKNFGNIGYRYQLLVHEWPDVLVSAPRKPYWLISTRKLLDPAEDAESLLISIFQKLGGFAFDPYLV